MSTADIMSKCAACGNDGDGLKTCTACKLVKYCSVACQKSQRPKHKKECKKRAAELHDEALFRQPPPRDECPICCLPLLSETRYQSCCGKSLCKGCICADVIENNRYLCPFCRTPEATSEEEVIKRLKRRVEAGDARAMYNLGFDYYRGEFGLPIDYNKAIELWLRAGELGNAAGHHNIAHAYSTGQGVERDMKKSKHYSELAAMGGYVYARHNLGVVEGNAGNISRAIKHFMISAGAGYDDSLKRIREGYMKGHATKNDFEKALRAHKQAKDEMKSDRREEADALYGQIYF